MGQDPDGSQRGRDRGRGEEQGKGRADRRSHREQQHERDQRQGDQLAFCEVFVKERCDIVADRGRPGDMKREAGDVTDLGPNRFGEVGGVGAAQRRRDLDHEQAVVDLSRRARARLAADRVLGALPGLNKRSLGSHLARPRPRKRA